MDNISDFPLSWEYNFAKIEISWENISVRIKQIDTQGSRLSVHFLCIGVGSLSKEWVTCVIVEVMDPF